MPPSSLPRSIHNLAPLESGGVVARRGFVFQDHVAVSFCLEMVTEHNLNEVWCETQDDITLIRITEGREEVEFIQVKDVELGQLWSIAKLCEREKTSANPTGLGTSILEKSLAHDRCSEPCRFRIITSGSVNKQLAFLRIPLTSPMRDLSNGNFTELCTEVNDRVGDFKSENGNSGSFWLSNVLWEIGHSEDTVLRKNIETLGCWITSIGGHLSPDRIRNKIYSNLLQQVQNAAYAKWEIDPDAKKIRRRKFVAGLQDLVAEAHHSTSAGAGQDMQRKMQEACISPDYIVTAQEHRRLYRQEVITPRYLDLSAQSLIKGEIFSELSRLLADMDTGNLPEGIDFYRLCQMKMRELRDSLSINPQPPLHFFDGCMHDITDRCGHRYRKVSV